jgi:hypothetical protein
MFQVFILILKIKERWEGFEDINFSKNNNTRDQGHQQPAQTDPSECSNPR